jgi:hypothetical protein
MHVSGGDRSNQLSMAALSDRECDEERPAVMISANGNQSIFASRVSGIRRDARLAPLHRLDFSDRNAVALALRPISLVPIKPLENEIHSEICGLRRKIHEPARCPPPEVCRSSGGWSTSE